MTVDENDFSKHLCIKYGWVDDLRFYVLFNSISVISGQCLDDNERLCAMDALAEEQQELEALVESLDKTCTRFKMEISAEKTKLMTNSANGIQREINVKGQKLGTVTSFKYLGAVVSDDGFKPEVL